MIAPTLTNFQPISASRQLLGLTALISLLLVGCNQSTLWDNEYICNGQEQSSSYFVDADPTQSIRKNYSSAIDFHLRANHAIVRSYLTTIDSTSADSLSFSGKNQASWISGQFNQSNGQLVLVEGRVLEIAGRQQQIRTSGEFKCKRVGSTT